MSTQNRSDDLELVGKNLELIISSNNYQLAHEDRELLNSDEMRGVRMLLEINKPEKIPVSYTHLTLPTICSV